MMVKVVAYDVFKSKYWKNIQINVWWISILDSWIHLSVQNISIDIFTKYLQFVVVVTYLNPTKDIQY